MRSSFGNLILPAAIAAGLVLTVFGSAAEAGGFAHRSGFAHHGGFAQHRPGGQVPRHYGNRRGVQYLPTLPVLVPPPGQVGRGVAGVVRAPGWGTRAAVAAGLVPGIPQRVPQATAGTQMRFVQGRYFVQGYAGYGLPTALPGVGTYVGGIQAVSSPGNGNYFTIDGSVDLAAPAAGVRPMAKIIEVKADGNDAGCDMDHGVCVIRP